VLKQCEPTLLRLLREHREYRLVLTGHSLGAGAAFPPLE
jgi:hypothetical protein